MTKHSTSHIPMLHHSNLSSLSSMDMSHAVSVISSWMSSDTSCFVIVMGAMATWRPAWVCRASNVVTETTAEWGRVYETGITIPLDKKKKFIVNTKTIEIYNILFKSWSYSKIYLKKNVFKITLKIYLTNYSVH